MESRFLESMINRTNFCFAKFGVNDIMDYSAERSQEV